MSKKRVLFVSEASYLNTGYATYSREVLKRLHSSNKYEVAEFSIYGGIEDKRRSSIPWKNYPNMPDPQNEEQNKVYGSDSMNQFGKWRFERVCIDFKPDVVLTIRDWWMDAFIQHSPLRKYFKWIWMPTVDASPQNEEWIDSFSDADTVLTYSDWAVDVLKSQSDQMNVKCAAPPSASEDFFQIPNKSAHKERMGIDPSWKIIGTVMRNQRRKLFPELFEAFGKYLKKTGKTDVYLYCHTSYPDNGWDLPKYLFENEISSRVLFTYVCEACGAPSPSKFSDTAKPCDKCGQFAAKMSNVSSGVDTKTLGAIYNLFDIYIQPANSEGFGLPIVEAAACGVPVLATDYSAMESEVRKLSGYPIKLRTKHVEMETGCDRALPDTDHIVELFEKLLDKPEPLRLTEGKRARDAFEKNYGWDKTAKIWAECIDELDYGTWNLPVDPANPKADIPEIQNNKELLDFLILAVVNEPKLLNTYSMNKILRDFNFGAVKNNPGGFFYGELSLFNRENYRPFTRDQLINAFRQKAEQKNFWENARLGNVKFPQESWL
jgi:glycosyltransferase involved in cell wall biosynthesis